MTRARPLTRDAKYTAGPWEVWNGNDRHQSSVFRKGRTVSKPLEGGAMAIAYCDYHTSEIAEANARLIACAPELLASLQELSTLSDTIWVKMSHAESEAMQAAWGRAESVIAKATCASTPDKLAGASI